MHIVTRRNAVHRLDSDLRLHHQFRLVHRAGPRSVGFVFAEFADRIGADPDELDFILELQINPELVRHFGGFDFHRPPLRRWRAT